ncbi:unnamed protein product [Notodromas monacha]|uniref:C2 domain-containing protein n=1 Tax=Notodromas monacha TaxID=399045 RepID=A0A7R9GGU2_9CRUS|nr:unnamed protein product [Notodromas monacha]CAG0922083.1 unnamed protein product [Notodromas monacha]
MLGVGGMEVDEKKWRKRNALPWGTEKRENELPDVWRDESIFGTVESLAFERHLLYACKMRRLKHKKFGLGATPGGKEHRHDLKKHPFFQLHIHLKRGVSLVAMDSCGTSDPYVKFKIGGKLMYKSKIVYKDLNPYWDEYFTLPVEDAFEPVLIKVFDYDWGFQDDFMGSAIIDMTKFELYKPAELELPLAIAGKEESAGELHLTATLYPKSQEDWEEMLELRSEETANALVTVSKIIQRNQSSSYEELRLANFGENQGSGDHFLALSEAQ